MLFLDSQKSLARKLDLDFDNIALNGLFSLTDLKAYLNDAAQEVWDYDMWDFAEHSKTAALLAGDVTNGYVPYPPDFVPSSIFLLKLGGKEQDKKQFQDFQKEFENRSTSTAKMWAEFKRLIFLNKNLMAVDTVVDVWGKLTYVPLSGDSDLMPFSPTTDADSLSGNQAIVTLAYAKALSSEKKRNPNQAAIEERRAYGVLANLKTAADKGKSSEKPTRPMFDAPDFFGRGSRGGNNAAGTFTWSSN